MYTVPLAEDAIFGRPHEVVRYIAASGLVVHEVLHLDHQRNRQI